jgi:uncharacterized RDD family membrane protein YckC
MSAAVTSAVTGAKAGFWIRVVAYIIDAILFGIVGNLINSLFFRFNNVQASQAVGLILSAIYFTWLWSESSPWPGQTVGMKILNLKVVRTDGSILTLSQAFIRWVGLLISFFAIFIGVIWVAFDANKQGWHDKIAGTYVVKG